MASSFVIENPDGYETFIKEHKQLFFKNKLILLEGNLGAGKTTFVKAFAKTLGFKGQVSSPSFSIVNEYELLNGKIYHFDLYRLKQEEELYEIGFDDYLHSGNYCLIEWPDKAKVFTKDIHKTTIRFEPLEDGSRKITLNSN